MNSDLRDILFLDIETVACSDNYNSLDERLKTQWARKAGFFKQRDENQTDEEAFHERAGIYAEFGKIIVIGIGKLVENERGELTIKLKSLFDHDEKKLLSEFRSLVEKMPPSLKLCAHNGKEFDFPYMCRRMLINGIEIPELLNIAGKKPWEVNHLDTMELWKFGDFKNFTSLELLAATFDVPTPKDDIDGSQVWTVYWNDNDLERIKTYCQKDVVTVAQLLLRFRGEELLDEGDVIFT